MVEYDSVKVSKSETEVIELRIVLMPRLDLAMDSGVVVEWSKHEGEMIDVDETVATVLTEKVTYELPSPTSGTIYKIIVPEEVEVPVGQTIAIIEEAGDDPEALERVAQEAREALEEARVAEAKEVEGIVEERLERPEEAVRRIRISPLARRLAERHGVDITGVEGTGPGGRIVKEDILRVASALPTVARTVPLKGVRRVVAERMTYSYQRVPHVTITMEVEMTRALGFYQAHKTDLERKVSIDAIFAKAVSKCLEEHPILNSTLEEGLIRVYDDVNLGIAVSAEDGLMVPVVRNADEKSIFELTRSIDDLAEKARQNRLTVSDVVGGTFTITNLGMFDVEAFTPIISPKQTAILGIGRISEEPSLDDGTLSPKHRVILSLSFDHRVLDGAQAARFLRSVKEVVETMEMDSV